MFIRVLFFLGCATTAAAQSLTITTLAGQHGASGFADGTGANARFAYVSGVAADSGGNVFAMDNFAIRKVTAAGVVTTLAGAPGVAGNVNATGGAARFSQSGAIARDAAGNLYVGDGNWIRRITPAGVVTTLDWWNNQILCLAVDRANTLYVGSPYSVRRTLSNGNMATIAGFAEQPGAADGPAATARFAYVAALAIDGAGNIYVADMLNHTIRKITPAGTVSTFAGSAGNAGHADGPAATARFNHPVALALDATGHLFVGDGNQSNHAAIRRITPEGVVTTVAGAPGAPPILDTQGRGIFPDGVGAGVRFGMIRGIAVDPSGTVYVGDVSTIRKGVVAPAAAKIVFGPQSQSAPSGHRATFSVIASGNPAVSYQWQRRTSGTAAWSNLAADAIFSGVATSVLTVTGVSGALNGQEFRAVVTNASGSDASAPAGINVDPPVVVVPLNVTTVAGEPGAPNRAENRDGTGRNARFIFPVGITLDAAGHAYVTEGPGHRIRKVTPAGIVTTLAGSGGAGNADGVGAAAQFNSPNAVAADGAGNIFVADTMNGRIRKVTPAGVVTTFAGGAGKQVSSDGNIDPGYFGAPSGLLFDRGGNLIVIDTLMPGALRSITPAGVAALVPALRDYQGPSFVWDWGGIAVDANGDYYFTNSAMHTVEKRSASGWLTTLAGKPGVAGSTDGRATNARFNGPRGLAVDAAGNVYVADSGNSTIRKITPAGLVSTVAGIAPSTALLDSAGTSDGIGSTARFNRPQGLAFDHAGNLHIADTGNNAIRRARPMGGVVEGETAVLAIANPPPDPPAYQWLKDGVALLGATGERLTISAARSADSGEYSVRITTGAGVDVSEPIRLAIGDDRGGATAPTGTTPTVVVPTVTAPVVQPPPSRLVNLSIRSALASGASALIVGFVIEGGTMPLLVRAVGPGLAGFGVATPLSHPRLALYANRTLAAANENWGNGPEISTAAQRVGAFALAVNSLDAALLTQLDSGGFTVQCTNVDAAGGVALVELYDAGTSAAPRLVNVSARSRIGANDEVMIAGFSISGTLPRPVLIRAIGPGLTAFGVVNPLTDPELRIVAAGDGRIVARNDNWGGGADLAGAFAGVGAFPLSSESRDAALVESLVPGTYSVVVSGVAGGTGEALVEVYEITP